MNFPGSTCLLNVHPGIHKKFKASLGHTVSISQKLELAPCESAFCSVTAGPRFDPQHLVEWETPYHRSVLKLPEITICIFNNQKYVSKLGALSFHLLLKITVGSYET